ncbi:MAG: beta-propeller domain-containing protein [Deltaproteobacteria bacterium]|nr:beta-propeller domain-containing protein [Deltaproteobacteria bacterium]
MPKLLSLLMGTLPIALLLILAGCSDDFKDGYVNGDTDFVSGNPSMQSESNRNGAGSFAADDAAQELSADTASSNAKELAEREIVEADIVQTVGNTLYALSRYRGLSVIDISNPAHMVLLGRFEAYGDPFEMYVRDGLVLALYSSFYSYAYDEATNSWTEDSSSRVIVLDVSNPARIQQRSAFEMLGNISDSRIVGDVLYTVSYESGYCWGCDANNPKTVITSLSVGNPDAIQVVDSLTFAENGYSWQRSVEVNQNRMYVAGPNYDYWDDANPTSVIQVVDISDPTGKLVPGASVTIAGQIESRWQMNEYEGVLRVISQPGSTWNSGAQPVVETFTVVSSQELTPLGQMAMVLPRPENLQSVRFDGTRGYAVTFEQTDPLFVIDLGNPAQPVQLGELEIPGWLYHMEPRGNRLFAIGYDDTTIGGRGMAVSLFDVTDPVAPVMLDRVNFGGEWSWMPEDQDRIHKAFKILDDAGLILMPYSGWSYDTDGYYSTFESGIQLIDFTADDLTLRGAAPHMGQARRAFLNNGHLFAMSDDRVDAFDITNRDNPTLLSSVTLSRSVQQAVRAGNYMVELVTNWWTEQASLEVYPVGDPDAQTPVGAIDLSRLKPADARDYYYWGYGFNFSSARLFQFNGSTIYLTWREYGGYVMDDVMMKEEGKDGLGVAVFDISDPANPTLISNTLFPFDNSGDYYYYYDYDYYYYNSAVVQTGDTLLQRGDVIVMETSGENSVSMIDLSDPANPQLYNAPARPAENHSGLAEGNGVVYTSHSEAVEGSANQSRFYLDRINVSNPANATWMTPVNIPGTPVYYNHQTGQLATIDYRRTTTRINDADKCYRDYQRHNTWYDYDTGDCTFILYSLSFLTVKNNVATLHKTVALDDVGVVRKVVAGDSALFIDIPNTGWYNYETYEYKEYPGSIAVWSLETESPIIQAGQWHPLAPDGGINAVKGNRVLVSSYWPSIAAIYDVTAAGITEVLQVEVNGYVANTFMDDQYLVTLAGQYGIQSIPLQ